MQQFERTGRIRQKYSRTQSIKVSDRVVGHKYYLSSSFFVISCFWYDAQRYCMMSYGVLRTTSILQNHRFRLLEAMLFNFRT